MTEQKNTNLIRNIVDELNVDNLPQKLLLPYIRYIKNEVKPYYTIHIILQLIIIGFLIFIFLRIKKL
jgi:hypothetical protein